MNLYDILTQKALNSIIYKMLNYITIVTSLNIFSDLANNYCNLEFDLKGNDVSGEEVIVTEDFIVNCTNREFIHLGYALKLNYYHLPSDLDSSHDGEVLKTITIPLTEGENVVSFEEYPIYLQGDCDLIIENDGTVNLPTPTARVSLTADKHNVIFGSNVVLTATVSIDNEPVEGVTVSFYDDDTVMGTAVTDSNGECTYTVENLALGDYWYHAVYSDFSSNNVEVVARKKNCSLSITTSANSIYYTQSVSITGTLKDEFNTVITGATVKLFENGSQIQTATTNSSGNYSFSRNASIGSLGTHNYYVSYDGDNTHNEIKSNTKTVIMNKAPTSITIQNTGNYTRGDTILITVSTNYGSPSWPSITVTFNGDTSYVSEKNSGGSFIYHLPTNLDNNDLALTASYSGNAQYVGSSATSTINIRVVDTLTLTRSGNNLTLNCKRNGANVANTQLNNIKIYLNDSLAMEASPTTDSNGNITLSNMPSGSYYMKYGNVTSNTV